MSSSVLPQFMGITLWTITCRRLTSRPERRLREDCLFFVHWRRIFTSPHILWLDCFDFLQIRPVSHHGVYHVIICPT